MLELVENNDGENSAGALVDILNISPTVCGHVVKQSNALTDAAYKLDIEGKRVLWLCLSAVHGDATHNGAFRLTAKHYRDKFGGSYTHSARDLKAGIKSLAQGDGVKFKLAGGRYTSRWHPWLVQVDTVNEGTPKAEHALVFHEAVFPLMIGLEKQFTLFSLKDVGSIRSDKHVRLYEHCARWVKAGGFGISAAEMAEMYQLPASQTNNAFELKRTFLDPAVKKINAVTPLRVAYRKDGDKYLFTVIDSTKGKA